MYTEQCTVVDPYYIIAKVEPWSERGKGKSSVVQLIPPVNSKTFS